MTQQIINVGEVANDGTGESLRTAFEAVNNNFSQIWSSGPVNSNVVIANNVISTTPVNTTLILAPGGIGNVQANAHIVPGVSGVYDLGAPDKKWDATYSDYYYGNGYFLTGIQAANVSSIVNGNSSVVINGVNGVVTVSVNSVPNVATFTTTGVSVAGNLTTTGNASANYFIGNGSLLTGIVASGGSSIDNGNSNVRIGGDASNVTVGVSGVGNVAVFTPTGLQVTNSITATTIVASGNITAARFSGNGAALSNITGANVTGNVPRATYAYTAAQAGLAGVANTVVDNAQPNITSVGILNSLSATGNITGNFFYGNGRYLTGITGGGGGTVTFSNTSPGQPSVGDTWIQANTGTQFIYFNDSTSNQWAEMEAYVSYGTTINNGGNANTGNIGFVDDTIYDLYGIIIENADLSHGATAALILPSNGNTTSPIQLNNTYGNIVVTTGTDPGHLKTWTFDSGGTLSAPGKVTAGNVSYTNVDGTNGQTLKTYGNGQTYWGTSSSGGSLTVYLRSGTMSEPISNGDLLIVGRTGNILVPVS